MSRRPDSPGWPDPDVIREAFEYLVEHQPTPDLDRARTAILERYTQRQRRSRRWRWLAAAAAVVILAILPLSARAGAVVALVARLEDSWVGGTLRNIRAYLSPGADKVLPPLQVGDGTGPVTRTFRNLDAAVEAAGLPILAPTWLPAGAQFQEARVVGIPGEAPQQIELWYALPTGYLVIEEGRLQGQAALGNLYDTDDARISEVSVGGVSGRLLIHKSGYVRLEWAVRGYSLSVTGTLDPDSALRVGASLRPGN